MDLPRIFIELTGAHAGWTVGIRSAADGAALIEPYLMDAAEVEIGGRVLRVPVVPADRRRGYPAEVEALCSGEVAAISALLDRLVRQRPRDNDGLAYGRWLFECLLAPAWPLLRADPGATVARGMELALVWDPRHADVHSLVWEAMIDEEDRPLGGLQDTLVVLTRVVPVGYRGPATVERVPRVLFASGASLTDEVIRPGAMFVGLLRKFDAAGICVSRARTDVSLSGLQQECAAFAPDVVHLVAHGETRHDGSGLLVLGTANARAPVDGGQLLRALGAGAALPTAVVLSACHSGGGLVGGGPVTWRAAPLAAELVAGGIPIVTAMAGAISEPACRMYTSRLIDAIHEGKPLSRAAAEGRAAALAGVKPFRQLDWAMPTIFLASSVQPDFRPLDPTAVDRLVGVADALKLRKEPVFIGRDTILRALDELFPAGLGRPPGCVAICSREPLDKLGSTRLLEEIGFRLLRAGHVPLLLAHYSEVGFGDEIPVVPRSLRALVFEVLQQAVNVAEKFELRPPRLRALGAGPPAARDAADAADAIQDARRALAAFRTETSALDPTLMKAPLAADLAELAGIMAGAGEPFGPDARVVVLADRVHEWTGALGPLLAMVESTGLGTAKSPAPVVVTASTGTPEGARLQAFLDQRSHYVASSYPLTKLTDEEATLGFQWVLLNQWHRKERYRRVFVAAPSTPHDVVRDILAVLDGEPAHVRDTLYRVIQSHVRTGEFTEHDDAAALDLYARLHP